MEHPAATRELFTVEQYLALSAKINYQLSARSLNKPALLALVLGPAEFLGYERDILLTAFDALQAGYGQDRRRLGTPGILHPLRAAAILARTMQNPTLFDMLGALLHDKDEELTREELGEERWVQHQSQYRRLLGMLDAGQRSQLESTIGILSNRGFATYYDYLGQLLRQAPQVPHLLHIKLSDRIDNTFDINLQHPGVTRYNFYRAVFDILFMPKFRGVEMGRFHYMPDTAEGVMLLSQLFKDTFFLGLLRATGLEKLDITTQRLFIGLAVAGIREAQWLALEMFNTCITSTDKQRALLMSVMQYCCEGGADRVTTSEGGNQLDGMLLSIFTASKQGQQKEILTRLFQDHELLAKMVLAFIVLFASFINNPEYRIEGLDLAGVAPAE